MQKELRDSLDRAIKCFIGYLEIDVKEEIYELKVENVQSQGQIKVLKE